MNKQSILDEIEFLFQDVLKVNLLTHANDFKEHQPSDFMQAIEQTMQFADNNLDKLVCQDDTARNQGLTGVPDTFQKAWKDLKSSGVLSLLLSKQYNGKNYPRTVQAAIREIILTANPSFYLILMLTLEMASIIEKLGSDKLTAKYCPKLYNCEWTGTLSYSELQADCEWDAIETTASQEQDYYLLKGQKSMIAAGSHNLTENIIHLVLAKIETNAASQLALFVVPSHLEEDGKTVDNNFAVESVHDTFSLENTPFCTVSYGKSGPTKGFLLAMVGAEGIDFYHTLNGVRHQMALYSSALSDQVYRKTMQYACEEVRVASHADRFSGENQTVSLVSYPHIANNVMYMKSISEGIRAAVYSIAFFNDCAEHGGKDQKGFFSDLTDLYTGVLKVYATIAGLRSIRKGIQVFGRESFNSNSITDVNYRNLQATTLLGGSNETVAQEVLDRLINYKEGSLLNSLIKQFSSVDVHQAKTEPLNEAIRVWQDYIGGIIVLIDDLKTETSTSSKREEVDPRLTNLWAGRVVQLIGDVIVTYQLVCLGLEAEKKLETLGVNFFNLQQEVSRDPKLKTWYNRLISAEYFALNVLSENEGSIRIIQRNSSSALDAMFV